MINIYPSPKLMNIIGNRIDLPGLGENAEQSAYEVVLKERIVEKSLKEFIGLCNGFDPGLISDEAYGLVIKESLIEIYCEGSRARNYALQTLEKLLACSELYECIIFDYPDMKTRGIIEGFYGKPWTWEERMDSIDIIAKNKMNTYIYAPKDDLYHREKWYEPYPEEDLINIEELYKRCSKKYMDFYYTIGPGLSIIYSRKDHMQLLMNKYIQMFNIGIRNFGILFDDIPKKLINREDSNEFRDLAEAHIYVVNYIYNNLKSMDEKIRLIVCPTEYFGRGNEEYISKLGKNIPLDVDIFWTGRTVCSPEIDTRDAKCFYESSGHKPLYWDNYPVNDGSMARELHLDALDKRDWNLCTYSSGLVANVMEHKESSMIPVITVADYLWNSKVYDKELSLKNGVLQVTDNIICGDLVRFIKYCSKSCLNPMGNEEFFEIAAGLKQGITFGNAAEVLPKAFKHFSDNLNSCYALKTKMKNQKLLDEISKWLDKFILFNKICLEGLKYLIGMASGNPDENKKMEIMSLNSDFKNIDAYIMDFEVETFLNSIL